MEMTIDETIIQASLLKDGVGKDTYKYKILTSLIDIAKKYQKIEQISNDKNINGDLLRMSEIRWVLEDGKID